MSELIVTEFSSLDGVMEAPGGEPTHPHAGWTMPYQGDHLHAKFHEMVNAGALLLGRTTYESFAGAWPDYEGPMADIMNSIPRFVVSSTLSDPAWNNTTVLSGDAVDEVRALKDRDLGRIIVAGSQRLVHALFDAGLVDEVNLMVFPVIIGGGKRVFPDSRLKTSFELTSSTTYPSGVTFQTFRAASAPTS